MCPVKHAPCLGATKPLVWSQHCSVVPDQVGTEEELAGLLRQLPWDFVLPHVTVFSPVFPKFHCFPRAPSS